MKKSCRMLWVCLIAVFIGNSTSVAGKSELDIEKLAHAVQNQHGTIIEWSLYTREMAEHQSRQWTVTRLKKTFPGWNWSSSDNGGIKTVIGNNRHGNVEEKIKAVTADDKDNPIPYVSYEIKGTTWDERTSEKARELLKSRTGLIFIEKPVVFSCIKGLFNDEEEFGQSLVNGLMSSLLAIEKEALREEEFISISAYSSLFSQSLTLPGKEMNLQVGLRKNKAGHGTYFTVGTPILTNEY